MTAPPEANGPRLLATIPGGLFFKVDTPPGVPDFDSVRSRHASLVRESAVFAHLDRTERGAIFDSLSRTIERCSYHGLRYDELRACLEERRKNLPGEVMWDALVAGLHFELQAMCGAARVAVDELVHAAARRHRVARSRKSEEDWAAYGLICSRNPPRGTGVDEVHLLRRYADWFATLNAYRNSFFHAGWRHGGGHFDANDTRAATKAPSANALLVPDRRSLKSRTKPHEWTYNEQETTDSVVGKVRLGFDGVLRELFLGPWQTPEPTPGRLPKDEHPNVVVVLVVPAIVETPGALFIPLFTTEERARQCAAFGGSSGVELVSVPVSTAVAGQRAVSFSLTGLEQSRVPPNVKEIHLVLDPVPKDEEWREVKAAAHARLILEDLHRAGLHHPISLPVVNLERVFVWRPPISHDWFP